MFRARTKTCVPCRTLSLLADRFVAACIVASPPSAPMACPARARDAVASIGEEPDRDNGLLKVLINAYRFERFRSRLLVWFEEARFWALGSIQYLRLMNIRESPCPALVKSGRSLTNGYEKRRVVSQAKSRLRSTECGAIQPGLSEPAMRSSHTNQENEG
jgi:hypothetical protein